MHILNVAHSPSRYYVLVLAYILLHLPMDGAFAQDQSISTSKDSSGASKSTFFPLTPETLSNYQVSIQTASNLPLTHSEFSLVFERLDNSTLQPVSPGASKGRLKFPEQATAAASTELTNSTKEIQEIGEWELEYRGSKSGSLPSASDTAIVGGSTRIGSQEGSGKAVDLKIKYRKSKKNADTTTTYELEWSLDITKEGKAIGTMTGYIESKREDASGSRVQSTRIDPDGNMVMQYITAGNQGYRSESTTTFDRNGGSTTIVKDNYRTDTSKENTNRKPIEFKRHWFDIGIGNAIDHQYTEKKEFPHDNPCLDQVFSRLANEQYSTEVMNKLQELKPKYLLQPLGSRASNAVFESSVYANYDRYSITIPKENIPASFSPFEELARWPSNIGAVPLQDTNASNVFNSVNVFSPLESPANVGDVIGIRIPGYPAPGFRGIVNVMITQMKPTYFRVSTLETEVSPGRRLRHPVSGSREFGFARNADGSITFYTQGLDSPNSNLVNTFGGDSQKKGWTHFMIGLGQRFGMTEEEAKEIVERDSFGNRSIDAKPDCD